MLYAAGMFLSSCSEFRFVTMFTWTLVCFLEFELGITLLSCLLFDENFSWCRPYGGAFDVRKVVGSRFFIVSGNISFETVQAFLAEFYHPTHEKGNSEWSASYHGVFIFFFFPFSSSFSKTMWLISHEEWSKVTWNHGFLTDGIGSYPELASDLESRQQATNLVDKHPVYLADWLHCWALLQTCGLFLYKSLLWLLSSRRKYFHNFKVAMHCYKLRIVYLNVESCQNLIACKLRDEVESRDFQVRVEVVIDALQG